MHIHPTAVIEPGARLGQGVTVGPLAYVAADTQIGHGCYLGPSSTIHSHTTLGDGCRIHARAVIGDLPQDLAFKGAMSCVRVGAHRVVREGVTIHRGTQADSVTVVGDHCLLMAHSHIAHNATVGHRVRIANGALVGGYATIGDQALIGENCLIHQFTRVGRLAMMAGGSATQQDVPPFCLTQSLATNTLVGLNQAGLQRAGLSRQDCQQLQAAFQHLFGSGLLLSTAVEQLEATAPSALVLELCDFIKTSQRGICKTSQSRPRISSHRSDSLAGDTADPPFDPVVMAESPRVAKS